MLGGGSWGTALAMLLAEAGRRVTLWDRSAELADSIAKPAASTARYLPGIALAERARGDFADGGGRRAGERPG